METSTSFYATLPSNACAHLYPDNKQSSYKIELPRTLYLPQQYEVALVEMQYPVSWKTFAEESSYTIMIRIPTADDPYAHLQQLFFPSSYYQNIGEMVNAMNSKLEAYFATNELDAFAAFTNNPLEQKIKLETSENVFLHFEEETCDLLGLKYGEWLTGSFHAPYRHDISRGFHALYVYCSVCEAQIVGNANVPLLRTVAIDGRRGEHVMKSYGEPHYVPVNTNQVTTIEIDIKDDTDRNVPFMFGKVVCKLHFRQQAIQHNQSK